VLRNKKKVDGDNYRKEGEDAGDILAVGEKRDSSVLYEEPS